jgi:hypothetical protein
MADETRFDASEALAIGLATHVAGKVKGAIPPEYLAKFEHVPSDPGRQSAGRGDLDCPKHEGGSVCLSKGPHRRTLGSHQGARVCQSGFDAHQVLTLGA